MVLFFLVAAASTIFVFISVLHFFLPAATGMRGPAFGRTAVDLAISGTLPGYRMRNGCGPQGKWSQGADRNRKVYRREYSGDYFTVKFFQVAPECWCLWHSL